MHTVGLILGVSGHTVRKWVDKQILPAGFDTGGIHITRSDLVDFMKKHGFWECTPAVSRYLMELEP